MKNVLHHQALVLRRQGFSVEEISMRLAVAKSTAYVWVKDQVLSAVAQDRLMGRGIHGRAKGAATNRKKRLALLRGIQMSVRGEFGQLDVSKKLAKLLCAMLFWCEGNKDLSSVSFTNSDPLLMRTFLTLLRQSFMLDPAKFRVCLHLHEYHSEKTQKRFWSRIMKIPEKYFMKSYLKPHTGKNK